MLTSCKMIAWMALILVILSGCAQATPTPTPIQPPATSTPTPIQPAVTPTAGLPTTDNFKPADCPFDVSDALPKPLCGYLTVPENRSKPNGVTIQLAVAVDKSKGSTPEDGPVLFMLAPEDGFAAYSSVFMPQEELQLYSTHDFVFMDMRGVGFSKPAFSCPEYLDAINTWQKDPFSAEVLQISLKAQKTCHDNLVSSGADLTAYTVEATAADYEDLRQALGYSQWNIYALAYGSRITFEMLRSYPKTIRSVVFQDVLPPQVVVTADQAAYAVEALNLFFRSCNDDVNCGKAFPDLKKVFYELVNQLNANPVTVPVTDPSSGKIYQVLMTGDRLIRLVVMALYSSDVETSFMSDLSVHIPRMIYQVKEQKYDELSTVIWPAELNGYYNLPIDMNVITYCYEEFGTTTLEQINSAVSTIESPLKEYFLKLAKSNADTCAVWKTEIDGAKKFNQQAVTSDVPTMIIAGDYALDYPATWTELAAKTLANSIVVKRVGGGQFASYVQNWWPCFDTLMIYFMKNPQKPLDTSCSQEAPLKNWVTTP